MFDFLTNPFKRNKQANNKNKQKNREALTSEKCLYCMNFNIPKLFNY